MEDQPLSEKYVQINPKIASVELTLPPEYEQYAEELREKIRKKFSFEMMDHNLEDKIQQYVEDFLKYKDEF